MIQAVIEAIVLFTVTGYAGYRIGRLVAQRQHQTVVAEYQQQRQKIEELSFDLQYCKQARRQAQQQLRMLQDRLTGPSHAPAAPAVGPHGKLVAPAPSSSASSHQDHEA